MPENDNPQNQKRISVGFILSMILIIGLIVLFVTLIFNNGSNVYNLSGQEFVTALSEDRINNIYYTDYYTGSYLSYEGTFRLPTDNRNFNYKFATDSEHINATTYNFTINGYYKHIRNKFYISRLVCMYCMYKPIFIINFDI